MYHKMRILPRKRKRPKVQENNAESARKRLQIYLRKLMMDMNEVLGLHRFEEGYIMDKFLNQVELIRAVTLETLENVAAETVDIMPPGYNNTIRWHIGHILTTQDRFATIFAGATSQLPAHYSSLFANGTKPADWQETPPSLEELIAQLKEQPSHIKTQLGSRLHEKAVKPFVRSGYPLETIEEVMNYSLYHEGVHIGMINGLKRAIQQMNS
jgi:hypothetical protein